MDRKNSGRWTVDGGQWTVDGGQWTVDSFQFTVTVFDLETVKLTFVNRVKLKFGDILIIK